MAIRAVIFDFNNIDETLTEIKPESNPLLVFSTHDDSAIRVICG